ncbi:Tfp pilus assembly protein FimT/FimU [Sulfurimonas sp.]|uniref:pilus assembly FimT family protein n=1 Tax=Sulfurimonas sp. TaxID=2022749 RepID=UPI0035631CD4
MVNRYAKRTAFTLIELIFALVIIAISVVSIPIMTSAIGKGVDNNLLQETVFAAAAQINQVLSYRWDENSVETDDPGAIEKVIQRAAGVCNADRIKPNGHIFQEKHRRCLDDDTVRVSAAFGSDGGEAVRDDIDDFHGVNDTLFTNTSSADAYKQSYTYSVSVTLSDMNGTIAVNDEAKKVTVTVSNEAGNTVSELTAYTFNIGEADYYKRMYP